MIMFVVGGSGCVNNDVMIMMVVVIVLIMMIIVMIMMIMMMMIMMITIKWMNDICKNEWMILVRITLSSSSINSITLDGLVTEIVIDAILICYSSIIIF